MNPLNSINAAAKLCNAAAKNCDISANPRRPLGAAKNCDISANPRRPLGAAKLCILALLIILIIITQTACSKTVEPVSKDNYFLDTTCTLSIYAINGESDNLDAEQAEEIIDDAYELCASYDKQLSKTNSSSDISRINASAGAWTVVNPETVSLIQSGIKYSELSAGAFDITIGGVTALWDFHSDDPALPDEAALAEAVSHVNYRNIEIDGNNVRLTDPAASIDLGGIAKGYIADRIADFFVTKGVTSAIVNLGGNIVAIGSKPDGSEWLINVEKPYSDRTEHIGSVKLVDQTIVTSGVYERYFEIDGRKYHHILSTSTGYPVETDLDAVTLVAASGSSMDIDALSTICLIKGSAEGKKFVESLDGVEAVFCKSNGKIVKTSGMNFEED